MLISFLPVSFKDCIPLLPALMLILIILRHYETIFGACERIWTSIYCVISTAPKPLGYTSIIYYSVPEFIEVFTFIGYYLMHSAPVIVMAVCRGVEPPSSERQSDIITVILTNYIFILWRRAEVPTLMRLLTAPTVFKTVFTAVWINPPYLVESVGVEPLCLLPRQACYRYTTLSI